MKKNLDWALKYANLGWAVFPCHTIIAGKCSCKRADCTSAGKHPIASLVPRGHNEASKDDVQIRRWWGAHPEANIGIATGQLSGIIVVDIDDPEAIPPDALPDSIEQITGSGGRHVIYRRPADDDARYQTGTSTGGIIGIDSRADGGYIIAPPSLHKSGRRYEWEASSDPFDGGTLADAPAWWLDIIRLTAQSVSAQIDTAGWGVGELPPDIGAMLVVIPAHEYTTWRDVGMALEHTDTVHGLAWWDWWSSQADNYSAESVKKEWKNFSTKKKNFRPLTIDHIRKLADIAGYVDPAIGDGERIVASLDAGQQERIADHLRKSLSVVRDIERPQIMPPRGMMREAADYILSTSIWPQPDLAVANTIALFGALAGRKFCTELKGFSNIYTVGLCDSGGGKDHSRKIISMLSVMSGAGDYLGGENFASGQGLVKALERNPAQLFQLDEFGLLVASATSGKAADYKRDIITKLMVLYSASGGVYQGTEYAGQDSKTNPRVTIINPCACVYGSSTPGVFWQGLSSGQGVDGFLSRLLIIESDTYREVRQRPCMDDPSESLLAGLRSLAEYQSPGSGNLGAGNAVVVRADDCVLDDIDRLETHLTTRMTGSAERSIYSRVIENALKLSMIYAVSIDIKNPVIDNEAWFWGRELSMWSANQLANKVRDTVADNDFEASCKQVCSAIKKSPGGISERDISRKCAKFRGMNKRQRSELLDVLGTDYGIASVIKPTGEAGGRPVKMFFFTE